METMTRIYLETIARLTEALALVTARPQTALAHRSRRGAGLIEYLLLAALAVGLFLIIKLALTGTFGDMMTRIKDAVSGS